jgi:hypothetical protein
MDEIDAAGRQMLIDRPLLTRGRLSVYRSANTGADPWFPHLNVTLKRTGTDIALWTWSTHSTPIDYEEPPPYGDDLMLEKYFELETPLRSPRGLECVFSLGKGDSGRSHVDKFSAALYLYPKSVEERGVQVGVVDFVNGLSARNMPVYIRCNFPW